MEHIAVCLLDIFSHRRTGLLTFKRDNVVKYFFFKEGHLVGVKTNQPGERLGEVLFKLGKIQEDLHSKIDDYIEPQRNLGEILKEKKFISEDDLKEGLLHQLRETTLNTFSYFDAEIVFQEKDFPTGGPGLQISVPMLIEYGIRRMIFQPEIKAFFEKRIPTPKGKTFAYVLTWEEKELLGLVRGEASADSLLAASKANPEFFWKSLYLFYCLGLIDLKGKQRAASVKKQAEGDPEGAISNVVELRDRLSSLNYYQLLEVPKDAGEPEIKKAYFQMARKYHPDRFDPSLSQEAKDQIGEVFDAITKAYRTLSSSQERRAYDLKISSVSREEDGDATKKAEIKFRQAKTLYSQARYDEALVLLEEAIRLKRNKGDYYLLLALAESRISDLHRKAEADFLRAIDLNPWSAEGYVGLGLLYKQEGLLTKAKKQFQRALEIDPDHQVARKELEVLDKGEKKTGLKSLLSFEIFPKKKKK